MYIINTAILAKPIYLAISYVINESINMSL